MAVVELPVGKHEYKFFVDGQWCHKFEEVSLFHMEAQKANSMNPVTCEMLSPATCWIPFGDTGY